jgi:hydrogenase nickel incorporation protein HypA/HybF
MHEYSLVLSLIERVEQELKNHGSTVAHRITVSVGELSGVEPELMASAFEIAREESMLRTTELIISSVKARWQCTHCARDIDGTSSLTCEACNTPAKLTEGGEILFESVELEVPSGPS